MSTGEGDRNRSARHELLEMVPNKGSAAALVRAYFDLFPCNLRGSAPSRRSVGTCGTDSNMIGLLDVVVSAGEALRSGTAVGEVVSPSWPRDCAADASGVSAATAAGIAAPGAAAGAAVADLNAYVADDPVAGCDLGYGRGTWLGVSRGGLAHGLHLQPWLGRRPHGQRLARGLRYSSSFGLTESSPPEHSLPPGISHRNHLSLRTNEPHREIEELGRSVLYVLFHGRVLSLDVSLVLSKPRAHERSIQRQAHLLLSRATRTLFSLCRRLLLVVRQQF